MGTRAGSTASAARNPPEVVWRIDIRYCRRVRDCAYAITRIAQQVLPAAVAGQAGKIVKAATPEEHRRSHGFVECCRDNFVCRTAPGGDQDPQVVRCHERLVREQHEYGSGHVAKGAHALRDRRTQSVRVSLVVHQEATGWQPGIRDSLPVVPNDEHYPPTADRSRGIGRAADQRFASQLGELLGCAEAQRAARRQDQGEYMSIRDLSHDVRILTLLAENIGQEYLRPHGLACN